jgi:E3 ubiquitin-protein ligase TRIP12
MTPREEFINTRIASKLSQQLKDVLSICSGGLPAWCRHLVFHCKFLFPLDVRRRYFYSTAFGLGRALQHLQQQQTAEGVPGAAADRDGRESRIGRLQRQKVRVSRKRILESAHKVMELYAKHKAVLELEYFNEVGTGLGPTLEFYTLLSHDLQKRSLGMWRTEEPPATPPAASPAGGDAGGVVLMDQDTDLAKAAAAGAPARTSASPSLMEAENNAASNTLQGAASILSRGSSGVGVNVSEVSTSHDAPATSAREYVIAPCGLFPAPLAPSSRSSAAGTKVIDTFKLLGRTVAKALQDSRLLDLPLSPLFFRWVWCLLSVPCLWRSRVPRVALPARQQGHTTDSTCC